MDVNDKGYRLSVFESLVKPNIEFPRDLTEVAIDQLMDHDGVLRQIPVIKSILGGGKAFLAVRDYALARKWAGFLKQLYEGSSTAEQRESWTYDLNDEQKRRVVIETTIALDRASTVRKAEILAALMDAMIAKKLSSDERQDLWEVVDMMHPRGFERLAQVAGLGFSGHPRGDQQMGLMFPVVGIFGNKYDITELGKKLYEFGLKPLGY